jgi:3-dehydroquinate synthase
MAQVDAAIDFKQAINSKKGKNLLGSYYPAIKIAMDPEVLATLEKRHVINGVAESIKHALVQDEKFLEYLNDNHERIMEIDFLDDVVRRTIELKVPLLIGDVANDYNEMVPQYAHCVGHAVEHLSGYDLLHGEAVAVGMCVTAEISKLLGICDDGVVRAHYDICDKYNLPTIVPDYITEEDICQAIRFDKHFLRGKPQMALPTKIGDVWSDKGIHAVPVDYEVIKRAVALNKKR